MGETMKIHQLIEILLHHNQDLDVTVDGYEGGIHDLQVENIRLVDLMVNVNDEWYYGEHEEWDGDEGYHNRQHPNALRKSALNLGR